MTKPVEGVSEKILACAKEEFLEKGYSDASLRTIAAKADTTTGSIYSRFGGKEGLFSAVVKPVAEEFTDIFLKYQQNFHNMDADKQANSLSEYSSSGMMELLEYMYEHFQEFQLLVECAYGTKFQNFVEHLVEIETEYTYKYMETIDLKIKEGKGVTKDFMHIMNKSLFESFFEVIRHNMDKETAMEYVVMLERYHDAGWAVIYDDWK
mgnify:CR=1 FL=1